MSFERRGLGPLVAGLLALVVQGRASAGELDRCLEQPASGVAQYQVADADLGLDDILLGDLRPIEEFHPETDRWTERTNRIRISPFVGAWLFSDELRIHHDVVVGFRIAWEVPGFIGIRWDSAFVPWSRLEAKIPTATNPRSSRYIDGIVHAHTLSIGIFNPELSVAGLAFWAGLGGGVFVYDYHESDVIDGFQSEGDFSDINLSGNIFIELDYKIADIFHVGLGTRLHVLVADQTNDGRFYEINGVDQSSVEDRNDGLIDDLATVTEFTLNFSILF
jgi:hypothetical protein